MIFKWVNAILHDDFLSLIPPNIDLAEFLNTIRKDCGLLVDQSNEITTELHGSWNNIINAEKLLHKFLIEWENINNNYNLTNNVVQSDNLETVKEIIIDSQSENCPEHESSQVIDHHVYVIDYKANNSSGTLIGKIKGNVSINDLSCFQKDDVQEINEATSKEENDIEELYMNITVSSAKINTDEPVIENKPIEDQDKNPLDKLCQLLQIDEDEDKEKRLLNAMKKQKYEENLPFKYFCPNCSFKSKRESHYLKHMHLHAKPQKLYMCGECDFKTIRLNNLRKHEVSHNQQDLLECNLCKYKTDDPRLLKRHQQTNHCHKCSHCDYTAHSVKEARKHYNIMHKLTTPPSIWKCDKCPYKSRLRAHLKRHTNDVHGSLRPFLCQYCGKCFKRHDTLKQHKVIHGEINPSHTCPQCGKVCCSASILKEHMGYIFFLTYMCF
uniref:C2H2-type domain-containing protein n=1 Tax=Clastoptera arizonana TaxID=38151 RepID=A0A1B6C2M7_9HEMI